MTEIFGPGWGNYAIRGIIETAIPEQVSLRPVTPGWWILLAAIFLGAFLWGWRQWQRHRRNRYRRDAQAALTVLEAAYQRGDRESLRDLAPLLRATAMQAVGKRDPLASARGPAWTQALQSLAPQLPPLPTAQLEALAYRPLGDPGPSVDSVFADLRRWIAEHECSDA
ncbi:MAG: DUF4381 domain-containing protein [Congregibacter sp.]|nr:DUF4381 domain-containing protein [Congregibacter sp.]